MSHPLSASPTFCVLPFTHLFLSEEGKSFPCCFALESGEVNRDADGLPVAVRGKEDLARAWNSPTQREVRKAMAEGRTPAACRRCFLHEKQQMLSLRQIANRDFAELIPGLEEKLAADGTMPLEYFSADLRLGNLCNLRCQMCSPVSSRKLAEDFARLYPASTADFRAQARIDWHQNEELLAEILAGAKDLREIHFAGGEPFLIPEVAKLVRRLAESEAAPRIRLSFNTNGTHLPENLLRLFPAFRGVRLILSIDGHGAVNDYIRYPSRFEEVTANFDRLHANTSAWNLSVVAFNVTVQMHNLFQLPELIDFLSARYPRFMPFPVLSILSFPECLGVQVLPAPAKRAARQRLEAYIAEHREEWARRERPAEDRSAVQFERDLRGLIDHMDAEDRTDLLPEFHRFSSVIAELRGQKLNVPGV